MFPMANINQVICRYIYKNWIEKSKSQRSFAIEHNIEESVVRKIKKVALGEEDYNIPVITLQRICEAKDITLEEFFRLIKR